ncbi:hypothetical protein ElyMa_001299100 [Elysia marginata]|uniref:Uncharacterized protein n=1 Tax=Elysia marginata TaxID=1093978 RepID=A0AAV4III1_9GAST|nr:hypothetical protein ElyMa_001299100 [Elysia marginata]
MGMILTGHFRKTILTMVVDGGNEFCRGDGNRLRGRAYGIAYLCCSARRPIRRGETYPQGEQLCGRVCVLSACRCNWLAAIRRAK